MRHFIYGLTSVVTLAAALPAHAGPCSLKLAASVEAELGAHNELLIHAQIDSQPALLLVDTGAANSIIFESAVARFGLPRIPSRSVGIGVDGRALDEMTSVPALTLGTMVSKGTEFPISPFGRDTAAMGPAGLFGADYLRNYDIEVDLADHKVNLYLQDHCPGKTVYWSTTYNAIDFQLAQSGQIEIPVELDGDKVDALLDTGASDTVLRLGTARGRFGISENSPGVIPVGESSGVGGRSMPTYRYTFKTLRLGDDLLIHNPNIDLLPIRDTISTVGSHITTQAMPDMLIGMSLLRHLRFYIAYDERKLYYTVVSGAAPAEAAHAG